MLMKILTFASSVAATLYAVQHWDLAFWLLAYLVAAGAISIIFLSLYRHLFE